MYIEQLYTNCLAEAAYWIESEGEAIVIDPIRETEPYLEKAKQRNVKIKYVFETHFHADFVSGHIDLAKATGATIVYGPLANTAYEVYQAKDKEEFQIGKITMRVLHTPGHTPESSSFLLLDENKKPHAIFTGDTLFVGDVGRPDLLDGKMSKEELASMLFDSLQDKIKVLPDEVLVYPAHGPGSACGKNIGKETWSTIGQQKETNYAMRINNREDFIAAVTDGLSAPPQYFFADAMINKQGYTAIDAVMEQNLHALSVDEVKAQLAQGAMILDVRTPDAFEQGYIPGSINIGLEGTFAVWVGTLIDIKQKLILVAAEGQEREAIARLARVGYEHVSGFLNGGIDAWKAAGNPLAQVQSIDAQQFADAMNENPDARAVLDVRRPGEYEGGHVQGSEMFCLSKFGDSKNLEAISNTQPFYVHCAGGYRSMIAISILQAKGYTNLINVRGGWAKIKATNVQLELPQQV